jgi:ATP-dependent DNA helicase HFM1/MER3
MRFHGVGLHYKQILGGQCTIESQLHEHMAAHLNAEIASQLFMNTVENAIEWLRATFFFVRVKSNPSLYKLPRGARRP